MDLADRMRKALRVSEVGVQEVADAVGINRNAVSAWINGRVKPSDAHLRKFAMRTGAPLHWLKTGEENEGTPSPDGEGVPDGASYQNRTDDLFITSETLYRLS